MLKGFEYWKSPRIKVYIQIYWVIYLLFFGYLMWAAIQLRNPLAFIFLALVPYAFLQMYKIIRKPFHPIKNKIAQIDPALFRNIDNESQSMRPKSTIKKSMEEKIFIATLIKFKESIHNPEIKRYAYNINYIVQSSMYTLCIWFLGTFLEIFLSVK